MTKDTINQKHLIVLGNGFNKPLRRYGKCVADEELTIVSKLRVLAAIKLLETEPSYRIIFSGGYTGKVPEARAMKLYALSYDLPLLTYNAIQNSLLEEKSFDTFSNITEVSHVIDWNKSNVLLLSSLLHLPRIRRICGRKKLNTAFISAEEVLIQHMPELQYKILSHIFSFSSIKFYSIELFCHAFLTFDRNAKLISRYTRRRLYSNFPSNGDLL